MYLIFSTPKHLSPEIIDPWPPLQHILDLNYLSSLSNHTSKSITIMQIIGVRMGLRSKLPETLVLPKHQPLHWTEKVPRYLASSLRYCILPSVECLCEDEVETQMLCIEIPKSGPSSNSLELQSYTYLCPCSPAMPDAHGASGRAIRKSGNFEIRICV